MNATLVVSISVLMIGAAIAIYAFLTGNTLADGEDFSLKFAADVTSSEDGDIYGSEIYFCTGENCKYYEDMYSEFDADYDLPEFFALVGIDGGNGKKVLTELTLGWMFMFENDVLTDCNALGGNETDYDPLEEAKEIANGASMSSFDVGSTIDLGDTTITITSHDIGYDPDVKEATVLGLKMPTPEDCGALTDAPVWGEITEGVAVDASADTFPDIEEPVATDGDGRRLMGEEGRKLWGSATASTSNEMWYAAKGGYGGDTSGKFSNWLHCETDNARAQFFYKCDHRGCNMNLAFAGSDDWKDWVTNNALLIPGGPGGKYHMGFYNYQNMLAQCVNHYRSVLRSWGIELDYIAGHSLGGAAATVYAQIHGNGLKGTVTFGAPKSNQGYAGGALVGGWRFVHSDDPVPSHMCFLGCAMSSHQHVISSAYEVYDKLECWNEQVARREQQQRKKCKKKWWKFWCWFEWVWVTVTEWVQSCQWKKKGPDRKDVNFAHFFSNFIWAGYGALQKHSAYGEYPSIPL